MKKTYKFILYAGFAVASASIIIFAIWQGRSEESKGDKNQATTPTSATIAGDTVLVSTDEIAEKINLVTGEKVAATALEQEDFSSFSGLPATGDSNGKDIEQTNVFVSNNKSQAIVTITIYDSTQSSEESPILGSDDYRCDIAKKECQKSELLDQNYQGLDATLQKNAAMFSWLAWDSSKNVLFGSLSQNDVGDVSPIYACDTQTKTCAKTAGYDWKNPGDQKAVVPQGTLSPSLASFVMINQHDDPNKTTGKNWELLLYASADLSKPQRTYDISAAINHDETVAYDSAYSVAWSNDEKKLAFATGNRIYLLDLETNKLSLLYMTAIDEDGSSNLDSGALAFSADGRYILFVDSSPVQPTDTAAAADDESQSDQSTINALKKIDLQSANVVSEVIEAQGLGLKQE